MKVPADDAVSYTVYSVAVRQPPFWPDQPVLWFVQAEEQLVSSHHVPYSLVGYLASNVDRPSQPNKDNIQVTALPRPDQSVCYPPLQDEPLPT